MRSKISLIPHIVRAGLDSGISNERKLFLKWCIGLTEKGIQNVLRGKGDEFENYLDVLDKSTRDAAGQCNAEYGDLEGVLRIRGVESRVNWPFVLYLFTAIGAQTLAIRGSEKSKYGKLFEKLVLGSLLTLLGFQRVDPEDAEKKQRVF